MEFEISDTTSSRHLSANEYKALRGLNLHKRYRDKIAVNDVSIDVQQ